MSQQSEIEQIAAQWLMRREEPGWSDDQQDILDHWLARSSAHKAAFWRLDHGWREADRIAALGASEESAVPRPWVRKALAMAATIAILVATAALFLVSYGPGQAPPAAEPLIAETPVGGTRTVELADGSQVELNTNTRVRILVGSGHREIWLDRGEAYFDVQHDAAHPFRVHAGRDQVTVLGTRFDVRRDADQLTLAVAKGAVRLRDTQAGSARQAAIVPAGVVAVARGEELLLSARSPERVADGLAWRQGMLRFEHQPLSEVVAEFNRYNRRPITIDDPDVARMRVGGAFRARNADAFLDLLEDVYHLHVARSDEEVRISG